MPKCDIFVPRQSLNGLHPNTEICRRGEERKCCQLVSEKARAGDNMALTAYRHPFILVSSFKDLGRLMSTSDKKWPIAIANLRNVQKKWCRQSRFLWLEVADS